MYAHDPIELRLLMTFSVVRLNCLKSEARSTDRVGFPQTISGTTARCHSPPRGALSRLAVAHDHVDKQSNHGENGKDKSLNRLCIHFNWSPTCARHVERASNKRSACSNQRSSNRYDKARATAVTSTPRMGESGTDTMRLFTASRIEEAHAI